MSRLPRTQLYVMKYAFTLVTPRPWLLQRNTAIRHYSSETRREWLHLRYSVGVLFRPEFGRRDLSMASVALARWLHQCWAVWQICTPSSVSTGMGDRFRRVAFPEIVH